MVVNVKQYSENFKKEYTSSRNCKVVKGTLPLIITAGHSGYDRPLTVPDREQKGNVLLNDMYTRDIAEAVTLGVEKYFHESPHLIINCISRRKVDVNRSIEEGTESKRGRLIWNEYHNFIKDAIECLRKDYKYGLLIDIHGHTHPHGMIELGYLLESSDWDCEQYQFDEKILESSSIQSLARRNKHLTRPFQLLKDIGDAISTHCDDVVVPSTYNPKPVSRFYFKGGYTTQTYHWSSRNSNGLDVIQIELPKVFRYTHEGREFLTGVLVKAIVNFIDKHYFVSSKL